MKGHRSGLIFFSLFLLLAIPAVVFMDIAGTFSFTDRAFLFGFSVYALFVLIQKTGSRASFGISFTLLFWMGLSYIPTGASIVTERIGEWFFLFFLFGLIQYTKEVWFLKTK